MADLLPILTCIAIGFLANLLLAGIIKNRGLLGMAILFGPAVWYMATRRPLPWRRIGLGSLLFGGFLGIFFETIQELSHGYHVTGTLLPHLYSTVPSDSIVAHVSMTASILIFYEQWFGHSHSPYGISERARYAALLTVTMAASAVILANIRPSALAISYPYALLGSIAVLPVFVLALRKPQFIRQLPALEIVFFALFALFELLALRAAWWVYPGGAYMSWLTVGGYQFPLEELLFWMLLYAAVIAAYYQVFLIPRGNATLLEHHAQEVSAIQAAIKRFAASGTKVKIYHGSTNSTRPIQIDRSKYVDVSRLSNVLQVNPEQRSIVVEPNVPLDQLLDVTLAYGLMPPVVAEFPGITVGGAIQGGSAESSSYKYGGFHDACLEYEIVLGNGDVITATPQKNADIFWGMACAYGSLGVLTKVTLALVPVQPYVRLQYYTTQSFQQSHQRIVELAGSNKPDFIDGIQASPKLGVIISGAFSKRVTGVPVMRCTRFWDDWFYLQVMRAVEQRGPTEVLVPIRDYIFRYDRSAFWVAKYGFTSFPFNRFTRLLFAGLFKTRRLYKLLHASNYAYVFFAQDVCMPQQTVVAFMEYADKSFSIYPLWLCPIKVATPLDTLSPNHLQTNLVINVGIWGQGKAAASSFTQRNRRLEAVAKRLGGRKTLYAHSYYTVQEFWHIYNKTHYQKLRTRYHAEAVFPDVYQKTATPPQSAPASRRRGLRGLLASPYKPK